MICSLHRRHHAMDLRSSCRWNGWGCAFPAPVSTESLPARPQTADWFNLKGGLTRMKNGVLFLLFLRSLWKQEETSFHTHTERERERERERDLLESVCVCGGTGILFEEPNPTGSRPSDLIGLYNRWHQEERPQPAKKSSREEGGGDRGSTAARPTLTRDWGGPQVRDPVPIVSVNPEADPPQPRGSEGAGDAPGNTRGRREARR